MVAIDVFSGAIKYLKDHLIKALNARNACNEISADDINWVLTVPAIWSDPAKQFMREAAEKVSTFLNHMLISLTEHSETITYSKNPYIRTTILRTLRLKFSFVHYFICSFK